MARKSLHIAGSPRPCIAGVQKNSFIDYPGKIAAVVFLGGCNMRCYGCHNNNILCGTANIIPYDGVLADLRERVGFIDGVVVSGGEPTLHPHLVDIVRAIRGLGLAVKLDTNGTNSGLLERLVREGLVDYVAMDVKAPLERYGAVVNSPSCPEGLANSPLDRVSLRCTRLYGLAGEQARPFSGHLLCEIAKSIAYLKTQGKVDYMFRTTLYPQLTAEDMAGIGRLIHGARVFQLQQFVPNAFSREQDTATGSPCTPYTKQEAKKMAGELGKHCGRVVLSGF